MNKSLVIYVCVHPDGVSDSFSVDLERDPYWLDTSGASEPGAAIPAGTSTLQNFPKGAGAALPTSAATGVNVGGYSPLSAVVSGTVVTVTYSGAPAGPAVVVPINLLF